MESNYKRLGNYIDSCNEKNDGNIIKELRGISNRKYFQKAKTNTIGIDLSKYRIVRTGQFAFNRATTRNGDKISIGLRFGDDCIVSPSYRVFKSKDENILNSEYLMMWFKRPEFDRYARFKSHGSAHEFFDYNEMCDVELPIPHIDKQREIVKEYNTIVNRIKLNEQLNKKLEETAQAIYKHWFVDFEFPNEDGKPYKSSGGKMVYNTELDKDVPEGWGVGNLIDIAEITMGQSPSGESYNEDGNGEIFYQGRTEFGFRFPRIRTYTTQPKRQAFKNDILMSVRAPVGDLNIANNHCCIGRGIAALRSRIQCNSFLFYLMQDVKQQFEVSNDEGTIFGSITKDGLHEIKVLISKNGIVKLFEELIEKIDNSIKNNCSQIVYLIQMKDLLLSKMTKI